MVYSSIEKEKAKVEEERERERKKERKGRNVLNVFKWRAITYAHEKNQPSIATIYLPVYHIQGGLLYYLGSRETHLLPFKCYPS